MMEALLLSLATFRITKIITRENGFLNIFEKFRTYLGKQASIQDSYTPIRQSLAELFSCPYCLGVWVAGFVYVFRKSLKPIIYIFMLAGLQNMLQAIDDKL